MADAGEAAYALPVGICMFLCVEVHMLLCHHMEYEAKIFLTAGPYHDNHVFVQFRRPMNRHIMYACMNVYLHPVCASV